MPKTTRERRTRALKGKEVGSTTTAAKPPSLSKYKAQREAMCASQLLQSTETENHSVPSLAVYKAQKEARREADIANKMAEVATLQRSSETRQNILSSNTINQYLRYERHWVAWCQRRQYHDICVIPDRAMRYMEENIAEHPDPEKGIEPLRVRADNRKSERGPAKTVPPSAETVDMYIKCLVNLYHQQCADPSYPTMTMQSYPNPRKYLAVFKDIYQNRLARVKAAQDMSSIIPVQDNTSAPLRRLMRSAWVRSFVVLGKKAQRKRNSLRDRLDISWLHFMMCRGENTRKARLPDLFSHKVIDPNNGGQFTLGVVLLMLQGKISKGGRQSYGVVVRNKDVQICPVGALALYMLEYWAPSQVAALNDDSWMGFHLVSGNDRLKEITNTAQYLAQKAIMEQANIKDRKVSHQGRFHGSHYAQACGASVEAIAQHGNWAPNRLSTHYLSRVDAGVALFMAGFNPPNERLWLPRNTVIPPVELQRLVFPFIEDQFPGDLDWRAWIENIMLDRDVFYGRKVMPTQVKARVRHRRPRTESNAGNEPSLSDGDDGGGNDDGDDDDDEEEDDNVDEQDHISAKRRHLILLAHMRKVVLQDAVALMDIGDLDEQCHYQSHHIFKYPVFKTQLFLDFRARLRAGILPTTPPVTDSLIVNVPGIHGHLRSMESRVIDLGRIIESELGNARAIRESNDRAIQVLAATTSRAVKASLDDIQKDIQDFRNDAALKDESLRRVMNRIASQVQLIIEEELQSSRQQARASQLPASVSSIDLDVDLGMNDMDMDLDLIPDTADIATPAIVPVPLDTQQEPTPVQPATDGSASAESLVEPPEPSSACCPLNHGSVDSLMAMISATATPLTKPQEMPAYTMLPRDTSLDDLWQEWFYGINGNPSILQLNEWYSTSWRRGSTKAFSNANAVLYLFKKNIIHAVLQSFPSESDKSLAEREEAALLSVKKRIEYAGSINMFATSLPKKAPKRKQKGMSSQSLTSQPDNQTQA